MSIPAYAPSYNFTANVAEAFVAVVAAADVNNGAKLPASVADTVIGVLQETIEEASATKLQPGTVTRVGQTYLTMKASTSGSAGDPIKLGNTSGHGALATLPDDAALVFARALKDWDSGVAGQEEEILVELTLKG